MLARREAELTCPLRDPMVQRIDLEVGKTKTGDAPRWGISIARQRN